MRHFRCEMYPGWTAVWTEFATERFYQASHCDVSDYLAVDRWSRNDVRYSGYGFSARTADVKSFGRADHGE